MSARLELSAEPEVLALPSHPVQAPIISQVLTTSSPAVSAPALALLIVAKVTPNKTYVRFCHSLAPGAPALLLRVKSQVFTTPAPALPRPRWSPCCPLNTQARSSHGPLLSPLPEPRSFQVLSWPHFSSRPLLKCHQENKAFSREEEQQKK